jgi:hypothetical protein
MRNYLDGLRFYKEHFGKILILGITVIFPLFLVNHFIINYFFYFYSLVGVPFVASIPQFLFTFVVILLCEIPFICLVLCRLKGGEPQLREAYRGLFEHLFHVYVMGVLIAILIILGTLLFVIPGLILLILFMLYPYVAVVEEEKWLAGLKKTFEIGKTHYFPLLGVAVALGLLTMIVEGIVLFVSLLFTNNYLLISLIQIVLSVLLLPYITIVTTYYYNDWMDIGESWSHHFYA